MFRLVEEGWMEGVGGGEWGWGWGGGCMNRDGKNSKSINLAVNATCKL